MTVLTRSLSQLVIVLEAYIRRLVSVPSGPITRAFASTFSGDGTVFPWGDRL
jgi:hypothetical protein